MTRWFLEHLGLREGATRGDVRKAYARLLKAIDQETELEAFQQLRSAYEASLAWVERPREEDEEEEDGSDSETDPVSASVSDSVPDSASVSASAPSPPPPGAEQLLEAELARPEALASVTAARAALGRCLDHPRIVELEQRHQLEWHVAVRLASGWQPGHEHLLPAAAEVFEWRVDRGRLDRLGGVGEFLAAVLVEEAAAGQLAERDADALRAAIDRLREGGKPSPRELLRHVPALDACLERFPRLFAVALPVDRVREWHALERDLSGGWTLLWRRKRFGEGRTSSRSQEKSRFPAWWTVWIVIALLNGARQCGSTRTYDPPSQSAAVRLTTCELGHPRACLEDAQAAERRGGLVEAAGLYGRACDGKLLEACGRLAALHEGQGRTAEALPWLEKACRMGGWNACNTLGYHLSMGEGAARDAVHALELYQSACDHGVGIACGNLGLLLVKGEGVKKDLPRAAALFEGACANDDPRACTLLGRLLEAGAGVKRDRARAAALFEQACAAKDEEGCRLASARGAKAPR